MPHPKDGKNQLDFQIQNFMLNLLKKIHKKIKYCSSSPSCYWGVCFFYLFWLTQKERFLKPIEKKSLYRVSNYSTILVITKIYIFLLLYFTLVLLLIMQSQPTSTAWTVTSTVEFYHHCWSYTEYSYLLWTRCDIFYINMVCNNTYTWKTPSDEWYF